MKPNHNVSTRAPKSIDATCTFHAHRLKLEAIAAQFACKMLQRFERFHAMVGLRAACEPLFHSECLSAYAPLIHNAITGLLHSLEFGQKSGEPIEVLGLGLIVHADMHAPCCSCSLRSHKADRSTCCSLLNAQLIACMIFQSHHSVVNKLVQQQHAETCDYRLDCARHPLQIYSEFGKMSLEAIGTSAFG